MANSFFTAQKGTVSGHKHGRNVLGLSLKIGAIALSVLTVAGCSSLNIGESEFSCPGMPDGVQCMSTSDVYAATNDGGVPSPMVTQNSQDTEYQAHDQKGVSLASNTDPVRDHVSAYVAPRLPDQPVPIRTPSQVMRVWVAPWEDMNGDLNVSGYLYTEIEPRRWVLGDPAPSSNPVLSPLTVNSYGAKNLDQSTTAAPLQASRAEPDSSQEGNTDSEN